MKGLIFRYAPAVAAIGVATGILAFAADRKPVENVVTAATFSFKPGIEISEEVAKSGSVILITESKLDEERSIRCEMRVFNSSPIPVGLKSSGVAPVPVHLDALKESVTYAIDRQPISTQEHKLDVNRLVIASQVIKIYATGVIPLAGQQSLVLECKKDGAEPIKGDDIKKAIPQIEFGSN